MASVLITSIEHVFAKAASDIVTAAKWIESKALPALQKVSATAPTVEAITALIDPAAANIERVAYAGLGVIIKAIEDAVPAAAAGGMSVSLDAQLVSDIKSIIPTIKAAAASTSAPTSPAV